jgi:hypothetical protein
MQKGHAACGRLVGEIVQIFTSSKHLDWPNLNFTARFWTLHWLSNIYYSEKETIHSRKTTSHPALQSEAAWALSNVASRVRCMSLLDFECRFLLLSPFHLTSLPFIPIVYVLLQWGMLLLLSQCTQPPS